MVGVLVVAQCRSVNSFGVRRLAFGVWRLAFGVWRSAFGVRRSAFGVRRSAFGVRRSAFGVRRSAFGVFGHLEDLSTKGFRAESSLFLRSFLAARPTVAVSPSRAPTPVVADNGDLGVYGVSFT
jgi:hypothetical protein